MGNITFLKFWLFYILTNIQNQSPSYNILKIFYQKPQLHLVRNKTLSKWFLFQKKKNTIFYSTLLQHNHWIRECVTFRLVSGTFFLLTHTITIRFLHRTYIYNEKVIQKKVWCLQISLRTKIKAYKIKIKNFYSTRKCWIFNAWMCVSEIGRMSEVFSWISIVALMLQKYVLMYRWNEWKN